MVRQASNESTFKHMGLESEYGQWKEEFLNVIEMTKKMHVGMVVDEETEDVVRDIEMDRARKSARADEISCPAPFLATRL